MSTSKHASSSSSSSSSSGAAALGITDSQLLRGDYFDEEDGEDESHVWTLPMQRTWEEMELDDRGHLRGRVRHDELARKRRIVRLRDAQLKKKGMLRSTYVIVDCSDNMGTNDYRPTRRTVVADEVERFVQLFFDQNPISQLGVIAAHHKTAEKLTELSGSPQEQISRLRARGLLQRPDDSEVAVDWQGGEFSLQNSLELAVRTLRSVPDYGSREVLLIVGALATCDAGDIEDTIGELCKARVRCSVVGLAAEVHVLRELTRRTGGEYQVAINKEHVRQLMTRHVVPKELPARQTGPASWVRMGFPAKRTDPYPSLCSCHKDYTYAGYHCPKCQARFCELPTACNICGLHLASSPHLARSYHHLFPVPDWVVVPAEPIWAGACLACQTPLSSSERVVCECPQCRQRFCVHCDQFVHESLHNCPGCASGFAESEESVSEADAGAI